MEFLELLDRYGYRTTDCAVVTLATDGLDPNFNNILCISVLPLIGDEKPTSIYVEGGDIYTSAPYTGISETTYQIESVSRHLARERLEELLKDYPVLIGHNACDFIGPFLYAFDRQYEEREFLDTYLLARYYYEVYPETVSKAPTLGRFQKAISRKPYDDHRSWKLSDLCQFEPGTYYNVPEKNAVRTKTLFIYLLGRVAPIPRNLL